jgi:hypothetical protein
MKYFFFIAIIVAFISCTATEKKEQDQATETFAYYLRTAFGDSIPKEKHLFILVPEVGCKGCRQDALYILHNEAIRSQTKSITYIFSPAVHYNDSLTSPYETMTDSSKLIDKINLPISNIAFVKTLDGNVVSINSIRSETTDSIASFLRK